jgi:hypothetical protein
LADSHFFRNLYAERNALRVEKEHERRRERFSKLMEQLRKPTGEDGVGSVNKEKK